MSFDWLRQFPFRDDQRAHQNLAIIGRCGATSDLIEDLHQRLIHEFSQLDDVDAALSNLTRFVAASRNPTSLLALFERDPGALPALLQVFVTSQSLANRLINDPESFDLLRASDGQPAERVFLIDELAAEVQQLQRPGRAALAIRKFMSREVVRIAYGEFIRNLPPEKVGRQLAHVCDAVLEAALQFVIRGLVRRHGYPQRIDGSEPQFTIIGLGNLGGEELSYASPLKLVFLCDQIDRKNTSHLQFYESVVHDTLELLCSEERSTSAIEIDLSEQPESESPTRIFSAEEAVRFYEKTSRTWQRMSFAKARVVAGSTSLGETFLQRLQPWVYRRFLNRSDLADIRALRHKIERRVEANHGGADIIRDPGGRRDVELTVQFLQLLHGGELPDVRRGNTHDALVALERTGCVTHQEATLLLENYARLCRLEHQLALMFDLRSSRLPDDPELRRRLAWRLGIRGGDDGLASLDRFEQMLDEMFRVNRKIINHLMVDAPGDEGHEALETELLLDPEPDPQLVDRILSKHRIESSERAMEDLGRLSTETVTFLSPQRCRHFFAALAPALLHEISLTPNPDRTLAKLVEVTDSLGAKAILWDLFRANPPTMQLMVRLCAVTPYLSGILIDHPGMIDELVDSLLMNRLPSAQRLDAQSIELCRGAEDLRPILHSFKNSAHLTIGVRDMLGKESLEATQIALADTAEACLRRLIEDEQEQLAQQFGDPVDEQGQPAELVALATGRLGGREPNYHSNLDVVFLYSADGETRRRVGGRRSTTVNRQFFHELARRVTQRVNETGPSGRLYDLDSRMRSAGEDDVMAESIASFMKHFRVGAATLWQRLALCKARPISGSIQLRKQVSSALAGAISQTSWHARTASDIRALRQRMQQTANQNNLKRGEGGTVDVEFVAQMLTLRYGINPKSQYVTGTIPSLRELAKAGHLDEELALTLIANYRTLRGIEGKLRLMKMPSRHDLPVDDEKAMCELAFLMGESDPKMIIAQCIQSRQSNRRLFDQIFDSQVRSR